MREHISDYSHRLTRALSQIDSRGVEALGNALLEAWRAGRCVYLCGNGGSAGNAVHLANDWLYGIGTESGGGLRVEALSANTAVLTCLANDVGYEYVYAEQIKVKANKGDILIVLSGSGNSANVVNALVAGNAADMRTFAIVGYSGGRCKELAQNSVHCEVDDMQISEDLQLIVGHMCMQWLHRKGKNK